MTRKDEIELLEEIKADWIKNRDATTDLKEKGEWGKGIDAISLVIAIRKKGE